MEIWNYNESVSIAKYKELEKKFSRKFYNIMERPFKSFINTDKRFNRIYFPFNIKTQTGNKLPESISKFLEMIRYKIIDGDIKYCMDSYDRKYSIAKALLNTSKEMYDEYQFFLQSENYVKPQECLICVSRHPYDIIGSSTGRGWTSCFDFDKKENTFFTEKMKQGCLVAYLISKKDINIKNPISRILIYNVGNEEDPYFISDNLIYGSRVEGLKEEVNTIVRKINRSV